MKINKDILAISYIIQNRIGFTRNPTHLFIDENNIAEVHLKFLRGFELQSFEPVIERTRAPRGTGRKKYVRKEKVLRRPPIDVAAIKAAAKKVDDTHSFYERPAAIYSNKNFHK